MMPETSYVRKRGSHRIWSVKQGPTADTALLTFTTANGTRVKQLILKGLLETLYVPVRIDHLGRWVDA